MTPWTRASPAKSLVWDLRLTDNSLTYNKSNNRPSTVHCDTPEVKDFPETFFIWINLGNFKKSATLYYESTTVYLACDLLQFYYKMINLTRLQQDMLYIDRVDISGYAFGPRKETPSAATDAMTTTQEQQLHK